MKKNLFIIFLFLSISASAQSNFGNVKTSSAVALDTVSAESFFADLSAIAPKNSYTFIGKELLVKGSDGAVYTFYKEDRFARIFHGGKLVYKCIRNGVQIFVRKDFLIVSEK